MKEKERALLREIYGSCNNDQNDALTASFSLVNSSIIETLCYKETIS